MWSALVWCGELSTVRSMDLMRSPTRLLVSISGELSDSEAATNGSPVGFLNVVWCCLIYIVAMGLTPCSYLETVTEAGCEVDSPSLCDCLGEDVGELDAVVAPPSDLTVAFELSLEVSSTLASGSGGVIAVTLATSESSVDDVSAAS